MWDYTTFFQYPFKKIYIIYCIVYILKFSCLNYYRKYLKIYILKIMVHKFINRYFHIRYAFFSFALDSMCDICFSSVCYQPAIMYLGVKYKKKQDQLQWQQRKWKREMAEKKCQANLPRRQQQIESGGKKIGNNIRLLVYMYTNYKCDTLKWHIQEKLERFNIQICIYPLYVLTKPFCWAWVCVCVWRVSIWYFRLLSAIKSIDQNRLS